MLMTRIAAEQALPFDPKVPNATTVAAMQESRSGSLPRFSSTDELMADLNADD
jgi:DNA-damage-inducible protein J